MAEQTGNYGPATLEAQRWLQETDFKKYPAAAEITSCIKLLSNSGLPEDAVEVLDTVQSKGGTLNIIHYNAAVSALKQHKRYESAVEVFQRILQSKTVQPDKFTFSALIFVYGELKMWSNALDLFNLAGQQGQRDSVIETSILQCAVRCGQFGQLVSLFKSFKAEKARPFPQFNAVVNGLGTSGDWQGAIDAYNLMLEEAGEDDITRFTLVRVLNAAKREDLAAKFHRASSSSSSSTRNNLSSELANKNTVGGRAYTGSFGVKTANSAGSASRVELRTLLEEARRSGDYRLAVEGADAWRAWQRNQMYSRGPLNYMLQIYGEAKMADRLLILLDVLKELDRSQTQPSSQVSWNIMLSSLVKCGKFDIALEVFEGMKERDAWTYSPVLKAHGRLGNWRAAIDLFNKIPPTVEKSTILYNSLLSCLAKTGQWVSMVEFFRSMPPHLVDDVTRTTVKQGLTSAGKANEIVQMKAQLLARQESNKKEWLDKEDDGVAASTGYAHVDKSEVDFASSAEDGETFGGVLRAMPVESKAGTLLQKLAEKPAQGGIQSIAKFYAMTGHIDEAILMLDELEREAEAGGTKWINSIANMSTYNEILSALGSIGDWERALGIFQRMCEKHVPRSLATYKSIIHVMTELADDEEVMEFISKQAEKDGVNLQLVAT